MKPNDQAIEAALLEAKTIFPEEEMSEYVQRVLVAAYAAQFPPSEDYAELVKELREDVLQFNLKDTAYENIAKDAADALEAVLADRDALHKWIEKDSATMRIFARYRELEAEVAAWKGRQEATAALLKQIEAERDALLNAPSPAIGVDRAILGSGSDVETVWKGDQLVSISYGPAIDPSFAPPQDGFFHCVGPNGVPFSQIRPDIYVDKVWAFKQVKRVKELEAELIEARDLSWFWEIVDADGLNNVASSEKDALRKLVRDSAILDGLKAQFGNVGERDGKFTINSTFQALLDVIDLNVETSHEKIAAIEERDAAIKERDALLARLAPVDDEALVEIAAKAISKQVPDQGVQWGDVRDAAIDAIAAVRPHIEAAERERCARIADKYEGEWHSDTADACARAIAAAIRSGK